MKNQKIFIRTSIITILIVLTFIPFKNIYAKNNDLKFNFFYSNEVTTTTIPDLKDNETKIITTSQSGKILKTTYVKDFSLIGSYNDSINEFNGKIYFYGHKNTGNKPAIIAFDKKSLKSKIYDISNDNNSDYIFDDIYVDKDNIFVICKYIDNNNKILLKINKSTKKISSLDLKLPFDGNVYSMRATDNEIFISYIDTLMKIDKKSLKLEKQLKSKYYIDLRYSSNFKKINNKWYISYYTNIFSYDSIKDTFKLEKLSKEKSKEIYLALMGVHHGNTTFLFDYPFLYKKDGSNSVSTSELSPNILGRSQIVFSGDSIISFNGYLDFYSIKNILNKKVAPTKTMVLSEDVVSLYNTPIYFSTN